MDRPNRPSPEAPGRPSPLPSDADWPQLLRQAALRFLGEPAKRHRGEWRYRSRGSLVVHVEGPRAGTWRDFEGGSGGGVLDFLEQFAGLDRAQALAWLPGRPALLPRRRTSHPTRPDTDARHRFDLARSRWASSKPIPTSPDHPARRWLARRKLWWPSLPLPPSVRWLDARGTHTGAGGIIVLAAPPSAWADVWPQLPALVAVQLVHLDAGGQPALDRPLESGGLQKRTYGLVRGAALIIGNPLLEEALTPARVAEGLADTLALARRYEGPVVFTFGTSGLKSLALAEWLVGAPHGTLIHSDRDLPKDGLPPGGRRAAAQLRRAIRDAGGTAEIVPPAVGFKDVADEMASGPDIGPLPEEWAGFARTLAEMHPNWPRAEVARISAIATAHDGGTPD